MRPVGMDSTHGVGRTKRLPDSKFARRAAERRRLHSAAAGCPRPPGMHGWRSGGARRKWRRRPESNRTTRICNPCSPPTSAHESSGCARDFRLVPLLVPFEPHIGHPLGHFQAPDRGRSSAVRHVPRVALRRGDRPMTRKQADRRKRHAGLSHARAEAMAEVVSPQAVKTGAPRQSAETRADTGRRDCQQVRPDRVPAARGRKAKRTQGGMRRRSQRDFPRLTVLGQANQGVGA